MQLIKSLLVGVTFAGAMSIANATPITWVDAIDFTPDRYIAPHASSSYTHDIRDDGYSPLSDWVVGYSLSVDLYDDGDKALEVALIDSPGLAGDKIFFDLAGQELGGWSLAGFAQLELSGLYDVTISSLDGDFFLGSSTLTVRGDRPRTVPEPGSLALVGLALAAAALASRRKRTNQTPRRL